MPAVAMSPKAGAHGELCGMMAIKAAHRRAGEGEKRTVVLVPESAHGTNPATAALHRLSRARRSRRATTARSARRRCAALLGPDVAAIMLTNPNTCGLFEPESSRSPRRCTRPAPTSTATAPTSTPSSARCGPAISASTPCTSTCTRPSRRRMAAAGRAPGRWCCRRRWRRSRRVPFVTRSSGRVDRLVETGQPSRRPRNAFGRMCAFHGQMGMFVRALAYMLSTARTACGRPPRMRC